VVLDTQARSEAGGGSGVVNTRRMAMDYIRRGQSCLKESKDVFEEGDYPMAIRRAQECVELSLKAALRAISVEYPREHDVGRLHERVYKT